MSDMKCPFCQQELETWAKYTDGTSKVWCSKCNLFGDSKLFSELIRTRKALDKANAELDYIKEQVEKSNAFIRARIKVAAEQIARGIIDQVKTIKEQKDK